MIKVQATVQDKQAKLKELQDQFGNYVGDDEELADTKKVLTEAQTKLTQAQKIKQMHKKIMTKHKLIMKRK